MEIIKNILPYAVALLIGYALGCINPAYLISKAKGVDILAHGSNNPGASNATILMGWKVGVAVGFIDIMKAFCSVMIVRFLFPDAPNVQALAGVACVIGHIYPITFRFRGGKGFASFLGMVLALDWRFFIGIGIAIILITAITQYIALATLTTMVLEPLLIALIKSQFIPAAIVCIASAIIIFKHFENIKRIAAGEEIKLGQCFKKK